MKTSIKANLGLLTFIHLRLSHVCCKIFDLNKFTMLKNIDILIFTVARLRAMQTTTTPAPTTTTEPELPNAIMNSGMPSVMKLWHHNFCWEFYIINI